MTNWQGVALENIANELRKIREIIEVNEGDYLKRDKVIDTITDVLQGMRCDDDDIYDIVRVIEEMPGERE